ncbi:hypothetical protein PCK1_000530 [Pneumocystis canis]|nr:hypothetical protein PCK1_000530 [Pneumocystis canis]
MPMMACFINVSQTDQHLGFGSRDSTFHLVMTYIIAGRAIPSKYQLGMGTILAMLGVIGYSVHRFHQRAAFKRISDPPIHASSPEEEAFIRLFK